MNTAFKERLSQSPQTTGTKQMQQDNCNQAAGADSVVWDFRAQRTLADVYSAQNLKICDGNKPPPPLSSAPRDFLAILKIPLVVLALSQSNSSIIGFAQ